MNDGNRLFSVAHGNVAATPAWLGQDGGLVLSEARLALRTMKGQDGNPINAVPRYLLVHPALETVAETILAQLYPSAVGDVQGSIFRGKLELLVEARLFDENRWYVFADPAVLPILEYSNLASAPGPQLASREGFDVLGMEMRAVLDAGAGAIDWKGCFTNPGDTPDTA